jgi:hypothetical protein
LAVLAAALRPCLVPLAGKWLACGLDRQALIAVGAAERLCRAKA